MQPGNGTSVVPPALFRETPEAFVAARDAIVKQLRADGRDADAAAVKAVRKPTGVVWALNQLAVRDADGVRDLLDSGAELRAAQQAAASGSSGGAERMREASAARRAVVARLVEVASVALGELGRGAAAQADTISAALEAASIDAEAGSRLAAGTLERVPSNPGGFGDVFGLTLVPDGGDEEREAAPRAVAAEAASRRGADDVAELKVEAGRLRRDRDAAVRTASKAREAADRLAREVDETRQRAEKAAGKHAEAEGRAGEAELAATRAERELARATERLRKATEGK
jgi:hypothetical protein